MRTAFTLTAIFVSSAVAAVAQAPTGMDGGTTQTGVNNDARQVVCVNQGEIGSRLTRRRVCRTRAEWTEIQAEERRVVERTQAFRPTVCPPAPQDC
ncbi:MAG: hypothetical protein ACXWUP_10555 [Allosphingosinicella sp.]